MATRNIRIQGDSILSKVAKEVPVVNDKIRELAADMLETMYKAPGVGLAGPQVGVLKRIFVVDVSEECNEPFVFINPVILEQSGSQTGDEGCLSVPGKSGTVTRPNYVKVKYTGLDGDEYELEAEEFFARAICHEYDHLQGILYVSKAEGELKDSGTENEE